MCRILPATAHDLFFLAPLTKLLQAEATKSNERAELVERSKRLLVSNGQPGARLILTGVVE